MQFGQDRTCLQYAQAHRCVTLFLFAAMLIRRTSFGTVSLCELTKLAGACIHEMEKHGKMKTDRGGHG